MLFCLEKRKKKKTKQLMKFAGLSGGSTQICLKRSRDKAPNGDWRASDFICRKWHVGGRLLWLTVCVCVCAHALGSGVCRYLK